MNVFTNKYSYSKVIRQCRLKKTYIKAKKKQWIIYSFIKKKRRGRRENEKKKEKLSK